MYNLFRFLSKPVQALSVNNNEISVITVREMPRNFSHFMK